MHDGDAVPSFERRSARAIRPPRLTCVKRVTSSSVSGGPFARTPRLPTTLWRCDMLKDRFCLPWARLHYRPTPPNREPPLKSEPCQMPLDDRQRRLKLRWALRRPCSSSQRAISHSPQPDTQLLLRAPDRNDFGAGPPVAQSSNWIVWTIGMSAPSPICVMQPMLPVAIRSGFTRRMFATFRARRRFAISG